jgi:hypothetical protein
MISILFVAECAWSSQNLPIYTDNLASGWSDYSWKTLRNPANASPAHGGSSSFAVAITDAWGALNLHNEKTVSTSGYDHLRFWVHGGSVGGQKLQTSANGNRNTFDFTAVANAWTEIFVPLAALGSPTTLSDLYWQDAIGGAQPTFYLDDISLFRMPTNDLYIYADELAPGWFDYSWKSTRKPNNAAPTRGGPYSLAVTLTGGWAALYLHTDTPLETRGFNRLRFWIHGGASGGQRLQLVANEDFSRNTYEFSAQANTWTEVIVPLAALGNPAFISDLYWQDQSGNPQPTFYLDDIALLVDTTGHHADCLFNWAERSYPATFFPAGTATITSTHYRYRHYPESASYLAVSSSDNHVWLLGPFSDNRPLDAGPLDNYLSTSGCGTP